MDKVKNTITTFSIPLVIVITLFLYFLFLLVHLSMVGVIVILAGVALGTYGMFKETLISLTKKQFALDYIAILAIIVAVATKEYVVASILALMIASGRTLETYGASQAKQSLTLLVDRIPTDVTLWKSKTESQKIQLEKVQIDNIIFVRKGEVIALDGKLLSETAELDESSLTGEPYFVDKRKGDIIRSGTINTGEPILIQVSKAEADSTYKKIIDMVKKAEEEKSPLVRLADQYSTFFTIITFVIAGFAYLFSHFDLSRVLAVLAVATPCPLIIATPIALLGGVNASAKKKIIVKKLASLEVLSRVNAMLFDKTGTITLGTPQIETITVLDTSYTKEKILSIAAAIERNSLHPLAKAIVKKAHAEKVTVLPTKNVHEVLGKGIEAEVAGKGYLMGKVSEKIGMAVALSSGKKQIALFQFIDTVKSESQFIVKELTDAGMKIKVLTGDKKEAAEKIVSQLGEEISLQADCTPDDKQKEIQTLKKQGKIIAMVGDGINDAPALALADVGIAFSNEEQTAASEAADIVFLDGNFALVLDVLKIARRTIGIARQSILWGIGLSIMAMLFASIGIIPPIIGAGLQEAIDVSVILNALRTSR